MATKQQWPELVGKSGDEAKAIIQQENTSVTEVQVMPVNAPATMDYREDRVRVCVDDSGNVAVPPTIG